MYIRVCICVCARVYICVDGGGYGCVNRPGGEGKGRNEEKRKTSPRCNDAEDYECAIAGISNGES